MGTWKGREEDESSNEEKECEGDRSREVGREEDEMESNE